jgi:hypothetical protein
LINPAIRRWLCPQKPWASFLLDGTLIFLLTAALIWPLFKVKYTDRWESIESTFISDARILKDNWAHPNWHPLWYCGTRFDFIYPPALRYGTAALAKFSSMTPVKAYHVYVAFFYCLGIVGVYGLVRGCGNTRGGAWLAAAASTLVSPAWLFMRNIRADAWDWTPQRLNVLVRYGEGPHMTALALLGFALWACWWALDKNRPGALAAAAVFCALTVSHNFYGATALVIFFPVMVWSLWITRLDYWILARAAAVAVLSYALCAFWLTMRYIEVTLDNLKIVAQPGHMWSVWVALGVAVAFVLASDRWGRGIPRHAWQMFVWGSFLAFALNVLGLHYFNFRIAGEAHRLVPEMDLAMILLAIEGLRRLWSVEAAWWPGWFKRHAWVTRSVAIALAAVALTTAPLFVCKAWRLYPRELDYTKRIEYRVTEWLAKNMPDARVFVSGSVRFWFNTWFNNAQVGGGSEQGLLNYVVIPAQWAILMSDNPVWTVEWLQAVGADAVVVHEKPSREMYKNFVHPRHLAGVLPVAWSSGEGDTIYKVPRKYPGLARVVERNRMAWIPMYKPENEWNTVNAYAAALEKGPDSPATSKWQGTDELHVRAATKPGQSLTVLVSWDPYWRASSNGRPLAIQKDVMGFMFIEPPPGEHDIRLFYQTPRGNIIGRVVTLFALTITVALWIWEWKRKRGQTA